MKIKYLKKIIFSIWFFSLIIMSPVLAQTYNFNSASGLDKTGNAAGYETASSSITTVNSFIGNIILALLGFIGVLFLVLVMYGAITWMTAQGNEEKVKKANGILMNALVGLIITLAAYSITYFLVSNFWK